MERSGETSLWAAVTYLYTEAKNPPANKIRLRVRFQVGSLTHCHFHCSACAQHVSAQLAQIARPNPTTSRTPPSCHWPGAALPAPFPSALSRRSAQNCSLSRVLSHRSHAWRPLASFAGISTWHNQNERRSASNSGGMLAASAGWSSGASALKRSRHSRASISSAPASSEGWSLASSTCQHRRVGWKCGGAGW